MSFKKLGPAWQKKRNILILSATLVFVDASDQCVTASFGFDTTDTSSSRSYDIQVSVTSIHIYLIF